MKKIYTISLLLCVTLALGQIKVLHQSGYKHDYVVAELEYIEEIEDTSKIHYIATLQYTADNHKKAEYIGIIYDKLKAKASLMGADLYYLTNYKAKDSTNTFLFKIYFGGQKFNQENESKREKGYIYLFDSPFGHVTNFFLDGKKKGLAPGAFCVLKVDSGKCRSISLTKNPIDVCLENNISVFLGLLNKMYYEMPRLDAGQTGWKNNGRRNNKYKEISFLELKYSYGRLLLEFYR